MGKSLVDEAWYSFCAKEKEKVLGKIETIIKNNKPEEAAKQIYTMAWEWKQ